ncbi:MAG: S8 family serine peptidase [Candidatus Cyclobacteriaceae bacterium M3_2C_046]
MSAVLYTYRNGQKLFLQKKKDEYVIRALPRQIDNLPGQIKEQVSSASTRVRTDYKDLETDMSQARIIAPTHHAYLVEETGEEFLITDRIIVTFNENISSAQKDELAAKYGLVVRKRFSQLDYMYQLTDDTGMNPVKLVVILMENEPLVENAEHDLNQRAQKFDLMLPTEPYYDVQWHLHTRLNHQFFDSRASSRCQEAWKLLNSYGSGNVVVGVTDDGCRLDHPDFDSSGKFAGWGYMQGERLVSNQDVEADPDKMYESGANHGTSCAGVIAGEADAVLTVGAAPGVSLFPIKWQSSGGSLFVSDSKLLTVLNYLADKVDILSNSWGSVPYNTFSNPVIRKIETLAKNGGKRRNGMIFLWAAGNNNCPLSHTSDIDIPYTNGWSQAPNGSWKWVGVKTSKIFRNNLVGLPGVMHVAAISSLAKRSHYSNYGEGISIAAASNNVHTYYRLEVQGLGITTTTGEQDLVTHQFGGTSSATPLVAGIAALVLTANPGLSGFEVINILKRTASRNLNMEGYPPTPPAAFNQDTSWDVSPVPPFDAGAFQDTGSENGSWSPWFGYGKADAYASVTAALKMENKTSGIKIIKESNQVLEIPDNDSAGIISLIEVQEKGILEHISLKLDIDHTYRGDLVVNLTAPSGKSALIHDREGGRKNDLKGVFNIDNLAQLINLKGTEINGNWMLHIKDQARYDKGKLNFWHLEFDIAPDFFKEDSPAMDIPDNDPAGIETSLNMDYPGNVKEIELKLDITHSYIQDLEVVLEVPSGKSIFLHNRLGGSSDNIIKTCTMSNTPALNDLVDDPIAGIWTLKVCDLAGLDVGKLNHWSLKILPK